MGKDNAACHRDRVNYSSVTPATGTNPHNKPLEDSLANELPTADFPAAGGTARTDPDKIIPGSEAATGVDGAEEDHTHKKKARGL